MLYSNEFYAEDSRKKWWSVYKSSYEMKKIGIDFDNILVETRNNDLNKNTFC